MLAKREKRRVLLLAVLALFLFCAVPMAQAKGRHDVTVSGVRPDIRVLVIGSSVADGWKDDRGGFIRRTFRELSRLQGVHYQIINHAVPGQGVWHLADFVPGWIEQSRPDVVVFCWGGLDDAYDRTPLPLFRDLVKQQIELAAEQNAVSLVVTPPVSKASYTQFRVQQPLYLDAEMDVARMLAGAGEDVYVIDVFDQMKAYLAEHGLSYEPFMADGWHPNARGHALAARFFTQDLLSLFHGRPVEAQDADTSADSAGKTG